MTHKIVPFQPWHMDWLNESGIAEKCEMLSPDVLHSLRGNSITFVSDDVPLMCGGAFQYWPGRSQLWAFLNLKHSGPHMTAVTHAAREFIRQLRGRIEFTVRKDFEAGHRWARALRFQVETPLLAAFGPQGEDHVGYVRMQ